MQGKAKGTESYETWGAGGSKPMLVLQAAEDEIASPQDAGIPLAQKYPDRVKLVVIPKAGHALLPEQPDVIAEEVMGFWPQLVYQTSNRLFETQCPQRARLRTLEKQKLPFC